MKESRITNRLLLQQSKIQYTEQYSTINGTTQRQQPKNPLTGTVVADNDGEMTGTSGHFSPDIQRYSLRYLSTTNRSVADKEVEKSEELNRNFIDTIDNDDCSNRLNNGLIWRPF